MTEIQTEKKFLLVATAKSQALNVTIRTYTTVQQPFVFYVRS